MTVQTFYRLSVWLPLAIPSVVALLGHGLGVPIDVPGVGMLLASLIVGGIPYAAIAIWGSIWIDSRPEADIRRRALQTPLWMIASFAAFCVVLAIRGAPLVAVVGAFVLGAIAILGLGYLYVVIVFALRDTVFGPFQSVRSESKWRW
jgi:hypothetical protein